jgi:uncharacterized protein (DUF885 family)
MRLLRRWLALAALVIVLAVVGAAMWFWFTPVGIDNYVNKITLQFALDSPETLTQIGVIDNTPLDFHSGRLDEYTRAHEDKLRAWLRDARAGLDRYGPKGLSGQQLITWETTAWFLDDQIRQARFEHGGYLVSQISGVTVDTPQFLTDIHVIKDARSVERYLDRVRDFGRVLREIRVRVEDDRDHGVVPPDFVIDGALTVMRSFIAGGPSKNTLVTTLPARLAKVEGLDATKRDEYVRRAGELVASQVIPGYEALVALFEALRPRATHDAGIWHIPEGDRIYGVALQSSTTTTLTADAIHALGLAEVARIEHEMTAILDAQGIAGATLADRVKAVSDAPGEVFPNTDAGRAGMLAYLRGLNDHVMAVAPRFFKTVPKQRLEVVRVPEYAQDSSPGGYYSPAALDGSRPGRFYINQKDTRDNPKWTLPTLLYHEGSPGHHFQGSAQQLMPDVPLLRRVIPFTAYDEGWALYAERIAKTDMGLYETDPLGDLGRLQAEMFRAVRLVVDTGMHAKHWSREQAIDYMRAETGMSDAEVTREIERYVVWPGQATAYKVGQLALLRLRAEAESALGPRFDLREFHEVVLLNGSMPISVLERVVRDWIRRTQAAAGHTAQ